MATIIRCDGGCGAESPNPRTRLHDANGWLRVRAAKNGETFRRMYEGHDYLFCDGCSPRILAALTPSNQQAPHD